MSGVAARVIQGDALEVLRGMQDESVNCCVTSPPYWGLRDYGVDGQIGLEPTLDEYISRMRDLFADVRRVLRKDGTLWLNMGDAYCGYKGDNYGVRPEASNLQSNSAVPPAHNIGSPRTSRFKEKNLIGLPWRVAFALQEDGWYLCSDIIWHKPNPMPESVTDRPTRAHEFIFLLTKSAKYTYDAGAIRTAYKYDGRNVTTVEGKEGSIQYRNGERWPGIKVGGGKQSALGKRQYTGFNERWDAAEEECATPDGANARSVWTIATQPYPEAHFATFPEELPKRCILAGCPPGGTVLDPFAGSGTTLAVALALGRSGIGIELNPDYVKLAEKRILGVTPGMFTEAA